MSSIDAGVRSRIGLMTEPWNRPARLEPLTGDASTRVYIRAWYGDEEPVVFMIVPEAGKGHESSFVDVHRFLEALTLPVPRIFHHDPDCGIIVLEDLGDRLMEDEAAEASERGLSRLYHNALELLLQMRYATREVSGGCGAFNLAFDHAKLMQEMDFFTTHCLYGLFGVRPASAGPRALHELFERMCAFLAAQPRVFTHRDYHSRNLMLHNGGLVMIDFQDARMGPAQYDLVSFVRDSYVGIPESLEQELVDRYFTEAPPAGIHSEEQFRYVFDLMALQRNIKALGTFGYQITVRGNSRYASAIPRTAESIARTAANRPELRPYRRLIDELIIEPASRFQQAKPDRNLRTG